MSGPPDHDSQQLTSMYLRSARQGSQESFGWLVERLSPLLRAQATYRLGPRLRRLYDPDDLVAETWAVAFRRLPELEFRRDHGLPTLLRFLATTLALHLNNLMRKHIRQDGQGAVESCVTGQLAELPDAVSGAISRAVRQEVHDALRACLEAMEPTDREVLILRGIEQSPNQEVAARLGLEANTVAQRYRRALARLRGKLDAALLRELEGTV